MIKITDIEKCDGCGTCTDNCPVEILHVVDEKITIDDGSLCTDCRICELACPNGVLEVESEEK